MTPRIQQFFALIVTCAVAFPLLGQSGIDSFYQRRLDAGVAAWANGDYFQAVAELRIAAFGVLDHPAVLAETLARLAVAQNAAGMTEEAIATTRRFVDVEAVAARYPSYRLDEGIENALGTLLSAAVPNDRLSEITSLSRFYTSQEDAILSLSGRAKTSAMEEALARDPGNARWYLLLANDAIARRSHSDAREWVDRGLAQIPGDRSLLEMRAELHVREGECADAWQRIRNLTPFPGDLGEAIFVCLAREGDDVTAIEALARLERSGFPLSSTAQQARDELRARPEVETPAATTPAAPERPLPQIINEEPAPAAPVSSPEPQPEEAGVVARAKELVRSGRVQEAKRILLESSGQENPRELDLAILEAAVLSSDWNLASRQIRTLTPFRRTEPVSVFYAAVTLYESNRRDDARRLFEYARPRISDSELVTKYERLIMGEGQER